MSAQDSVVTHGAVSAKESESAVMLRKRGEEREGQVIQRAPVQPLMQATSGRVLRIKRGWKTGSHLLGLRYHCLDTGRRVSDGRTTASLRAGQALGVGPALEVGRRAAHSLPDGHASLDLSRRVKSQDTVQDGWLGLMKTAGSWGGAESTLGAEWEGREGLAQRGAGLRVTPAGTVAMS